MSTTTESVKYKANDFKSAAEPRWCPGCEDYAILKAVQTAMAQIGRPKNEHAVVSGIGCSSRFPYYMGTYGFHTIHGRPLPIATGLKISNPELAVWIVTGDGDGISIGGNHLMHALRRNTDMNILLFDNRIYGLTKGQASPASRVGTVSPTTLRGSIEAPVSACELALSSGATFIARGVDTAIKQLVPTLREAQKHIGASLVEIYQNCIVYNDDVFKSFTDKSVAIEKQIHLEDGKPMLFGQDNLKGLAINKNYSALEIIDLDKNPNNINRILIHDTKNKTIAYLLSQMNQSTMPVALGIIYCIEKPTLDSNYTAKLNSHKNNISKIMEKGQTWTI